MKTPRKSTIEYVYAKLKTEVTRFLEAEIRYNLESDGDIYGFTPEEMAIYDLLCNEFIQSVENTEANYEALKKHFDNNDEDIPF